MSALTIRIADEKYQRLKALSRRRRARVDRRIDEMTTSMPAELDAQTRFLLRAQRGAGKVERGIALLAKARHPARSTTRTRK
ncbi:MAG: toxin-antitoxin system HicB family antitoxin [Pseudomonadota bacterium]